MTAEEHIKVLFGDLIIQLTIEKARADAAEARVKELDMRISAYETSLKELRERKEG